MRREQRSLKRAGVTEAFPSWNASEIGEPHLVDAKDSKLLVQAV
jgi:hypothetical protein